MKVLFIGHFSNSSSVHAGASAAGDTVQRNIALSLRELEGVEFLGVSQQPSQSWPKGKILLPVAEDAFAFYPCILNVAFFRDLWFGVVCLFYIFRFKPDKVVQYNSYLFVNFFVLLASLLLRATNVVIVQDYREGASFKRWVRLHDKIAGGLIKFYNLAIPVTHALAKELKLKNGRYRVFAGAMELNWTHFSDKKKLSEIVLLYAGALEKHNGVDKLLSIWGSMPPYIKLVIYGKGRLEHQVLEAARHYDNIFYSGFSSKECVHQEMMKSDFNICLRFSEGLDERFFFPSKFFSVNCYPGFALVNDFYGLPRGYKDIGLLVDGDLSNLRELLLFDKRLLKEATRCRQEFLYSNNTWEALFKEVLFGS